jgi:predicted MFS family arabinose efflux permease
MSAVLLASICSSEPPCDDQPRAGLRQEIAEGLRALLGQPLLRPFVLISALIGLFLYGVRALFVFYATRDLGLDATQLGAIFAVGGVAAVPGGLLAGWSARRLGFGLTVLSGWVVGGASLLLIPFASGQTAIATLVAAQAVGGLAHTIANVNQWSLRQAVTPDRLQARVTASHRFLVYGAFPLGALLGGFLATVIGMQPALLLCAVGATLSPLLLLATPVRGLRGSLSSIAAWS